MGLIARVRASHLCSRPHSLQQKNLLKNLHRVEHIALSVPGTQYSVIMITRK